MKNKKKIGILKKFRLIFKFLQKFRLIPKMGTISFKKKKKIQKNFRQNTEKWGLFPDSKNWAEPIKKWNFEKKN